MSDSEQSPPAGSIAAIVPAAGSGQRFGAESNKLFALLAGKPLWVHAIERLAARPEIGRIVMPVADCDRETFLSQSHGLPDRSVAVQWVTGGAERSESVWAGLKQVQHDPSIQWVAIHDAARPLIRDEDLAAVIASASRSGAAILASPVTATLKRDLGDRRRVQTVDRRDLWIALTPQVFRVGLLIEAYRKHNGRPATDDAQLVERLGHDVSLVPGASDNLKITYPEDLLVAEAILSQRNSL
jgi:2-C-methyl-D-erythritol 4-phosphate cytidylyltransferase